RRPYGPPATGVEEVRHSISHERPGSMEETDIQYHGSDGHRIRAVVENDTDSEDAVSFSLDSIDSAVSTSISSTSSSLTSYPSWETSRPVLNPSSLLSPFSVSSSVSSSSS